MELGLVQKVKIDEEMQQAYLDYAMSVIVARALPDARDGLKPVHRRILYAMYDMGVRPDSATKKSARIVGEVLGKYHPHGDMAVYEAMARMAQDFSLRYTLIDGQGNFGSIDGDPPAAMRYTEARLAAPAMEMLTDITRNTVDFVDNFDGTLSEPSVLPASIPNLLVNGATGIAVGMATSVPPHNLGEIVDAMLHLLTRWEELDEISVEDLLKFVRGPDFPTGGVIVHSADGEGLTSAYSTGRGQVTIQARAHLEEMERGRNRIIITELPYMTNKASLIERIAELAREARIEGIADLRDESDRQGMRIVIELTKAADPDRVMRELYRYTPMQSTFSIIMLALVNGEPRLLSLKQAMRVFLEHRLEVVRRRSQFELDKARQRAHILEGYRVALKNLDEVIELIRKAPDVDQARSRLMKRFRLSEVQAQAILDLQLRRLAALERKKIEDEYKEVLNRIKELEVLLRSPKKMRQAVGDELLAIKERFGDRRRTHSVQLKTGQTSASLAMSAEIVPEKDVWVSITDSGLISRTLEDRLPRQGGKDAPYLLARVNTRDTIYVVDEQGACAAQPVHAIPETDEPADGSPVRKVFPLKDDQRIAEVFSIPARSGQGAPPSELEKCCVVTVTQGGMIKKSLISELPGPSANNFTLVRVNEGDRLGWVRISQGKSEILLATAAGMAIRFKEEEVRPMGLVAAGVLGIKLAGEDRLVGAEVLPRRGEIFLITSAGRAKRLAISQFPLQGRYGLGVQAWKLVAKDTLAAMTIGQGSAKAAVFFNRLLPKTVRLDEAPVQTRSANGKSILDLKPGDQVTHLALPWEARQATERPPKEAPGGVKGDLPRKPSRSATGAASASKVKKATTPTAGRKTVEIKAQPSRPAASGEQKAVAQKSSVQQQPPATRAPAGKAATPKPASARPASATTSASKPKKAAASPARKAASKPTAAKPAAKSTGSSSAAQTAAAGSAGKTTSAKTIDRGKPAKAAGSQPKPVTPAKSRKKSTPAAADSPSKTKQPAKKPASG